MIDDGRGLYRGQIRPRERELEDQIEILKAEIERLREAAKYDGGCPKDIYEDAERWRARSKFKVNCETCVCVKGGSSRCHNCALYYHQKPCNWMPSTAAIDAAKEGRNQC